MALSEARHWPSIYDEGVPRREIRGQATCFALWTGVTAIGAFLHPSPNGHGTHELLGLPPCPSVLMFDRPCPGCGLTTSWSAFIHGDFALAFHAHPLGPLAYMIFTGLALFGGYGFVTGRRLRIYSNKVAKISGILVAIFLLRSGAR